MLWVVADEEVVRWDEVGGARYGVVASVSGECGGEVVQPTVARVLNTWRELVDGWRLGGVRDVDAIAAKKLVDGGQEGVGVVFRGSLW